MSELTYIKVKTETGHYLKEFSQEYGMTEEEIRAFHNQHCEIHELLPNALAKHVEYVYLPAKNVSERKEKLIKSPDLILPGNVSDKKYGIMMKFPLTSLKMHYTVLVKRLPGGTLEFHKEKTWVNNQEIGKLYTLNFKADPLIEIKGSLDLLFVATKIPYLGQAISAITAVADTVGSADDFWNKLVEIFGGGEKYMIETIVDYYLDLFVSGDFKMLNTGILQVKWLFLKALTVGLLGKQFH